jgi:hypothetical protein
MGPTHIDKLTAFFGLTSLIRLIFINVLLIRLSRIQCCGFGSGSTWICNKLKGEIRIWIHINVKSWIRNRIRIKVINWNRIRINLQMTSQIVWKMSLFEHFSKVLSLYLEARIRTRFRIKLKGRIRIWISINVISWIPNCIRIKVINGNRIRINL